MSRNQNTKVDPDPAKAPGDLQDHPEACPLSLIKNCATDLMEAGYGTSVSKGCLPAVIDAAGDVQLPTGEVQHLVKDVQHLAGDVQHVVEAGVLLDDKYNADTDEEDIQNQEGENIENQNLGIQDIKNQNQDNQNMENQNPGIQNMENQNPGIQNMENQNPAIQNIENQNPENGCQESTPGKENVAPPSPQLLPGDVEEPGAAGKGGLWERRRGAFPIPSYKR